MILPRFRQGFKHFIDKYRKETDEKIDEWLSYKAGLKNDANYRKAFQLIIKSIISRSWYLTGLLEKFKTQFPEERWKPTFFESAEVKKALSDLKHRNTGDVGKKVQSFLDQLSEMSVDEWLRGRLKHAREKDAGARVKDGFLKEVGIGEKGRDDVLRTVGFFDRVPIDRHERRFQIRTGIFHYCSEWDADPESDISYRISLANFCSRYLKGVKVKNLDMGKNPGILDGIIFNFCSNKRHNICGDKPNCQRCILAEHKACLLDMLKTVRV